MYKVDRETPQDTILGYLKEYYTAIEDWDKRNYDMNYRLTEVKGLPAWWTDKHNPRFDFRGVGAEVDAKKEQPKEKRSTAQGAVVIDGWVVAGQEHIVDLVIDFDTGGFQQQPEKTYEKAVDAALKRFDFKSTHYFEYKTDSAVAEDFDFLNRLLYRAMPVGWGARNNVFDEAKDDPTVLDRLTRPQKLRFYLETSLEEMIELKPRYVRVDSFSDRLPRQIYGESWVFQKPSER